MLATVTDGWCAATIGSSALLERRFFDGSALPILADFFSRSLKAVRLHSGVVDLLALFFKQRRSPHA